MNIALAVREIVFHSHGGLRFSLGVGLSVSLCGLAPGRSKCKQLSGSGGNRHRAPQIGGKCRFHFRFIKCSSGFNVS